MRGIRRGWCSTTVGSFHFALPRNTYSRARINHRDILFTSHYWAIMMNLQNCLSRQHGPARGMLPHCTWQRMVASEGKWSLALVPCPRGSTVGRSAIRCGWKVVQYGVCDPLTENLLPFPFVCYCYRSSSEPLLRQHTLSAPWRWHLLDPMENVTY